MLDNVPHILVFDSGAGGLSVTKAVLARIHCKLTYLADNKHYPYGEQPSDTLEVLILNALCPAINTHQPDLIIIACNTASTLILPTLRARYSIPIIGVVPAIKPAAEQSQTKHIAVFATTQTTKRAYTQNLINKYASGVNVILCSTPKLACAAEQLIDNEGISTEINNTVNSAIEEALQHLYIQPQGEKVDMLVLACTHFPLLKAHINTMLNAQGKKMTLLDSGNAIARRAASLLNLPDSSPVLRSNQIHIELTKKNHQTHSNYLTYLLAL